MHLPHPFLKALFSHSLLILSIFLFSLPPPKALPLLPKALSFCNFQWCCLCSPFSSSPLRLSFYFPSELPIFSRLFPLHFSHPSLPSLFFITSLSLDKSVSSILLLSLFYPISSLCLSRSSMTLFMSFPAMCFLVFPFRLDI